jgi:hypothetical protein
MGGGPISGGAIIACVLRPCAAAGVAAVIATNTSDVAAALPKLIMVIRQFLPLLAWPAQQTRS